MKTETVYFDETKPPRENEVVFLNKDGKKLVRVFESPYLMRQFINKAKRSKNIILISY